MILNERKGNKMSKLSELIKQWLSSWKECRFCNHMILKVKNNYHELCGEDYVLCNDCYETGKNIKQ